MVSKARLDLPEPDRPVTTTSLSRGISTEMFLRLCTRAPRTAIVDRAVLPGLGAVREAALELIGRFPHVDERQFLHHYVASLGELDGRRSLAEEPPIGQVLACRSHSLQIEVPLEVGLDLGGRPRFAGLAQMVEHRPEQRGGPPGQVAVNRVQRRLDTLAGLLRVEHAGVDLLK